VSQTWILTGSLENFRIDVERGFDMVWFKERRRGLAEQVENFVPAGELADSLEHVRKWPAEHWQLAFQGQLRAVSDADGKLLRERISAAAALRAPA
jgi:hypothetical protein